MFLILFIGFMLTIAAGCSLLSCLGEGRDQQ